MAENYSTKANNIIRSKLGLIMTRSQCQGQIRILIGKD